MSFTKSPRTGPRRRSLLAGAAGAVLLSGCTETGPDRSGARPKAVAQARARAAKDSAELAGRYDAVLAAHPALADLLRPLRAEAVLHAEAFGGAPGRPSPTGAGPSAAGAPSSSPSPSASTAPPMEVPGDEKAALAQLAAAERQLADGRRTAMLDLPGEEARLFASIAAAGDAHAFLLNEGPR
ncbi:hypothetical protein [Streptomyces sp. NPDC002851]